MGNKNYRSILAYWIVILAAILDTLSRENVEGLRSMDRSNFALEPKGTIKTIEVPEDGDLVDCVDIYKQPAFDDPLMKDVQIEPRPKINRSFNKSYHPLPDIIQNWHKYGECPSGTVPIRRSWKNNDPFSRRTRNDNRSQHEYATAFVPKGTYLGASAFFNTWNPRVEKGANELSLSQMWLASGYGSNLNTIEAGWIVYDELPEEYDTKTRLFIHWTRDNYNRTGCYNLECRGFVKTDSKIVPGMAIKPVSVYGGDQYKILIAINRVKTSGNWWLTYNDKEVGYFRKEVFTRMDDGAEHVEFGGEIVNENQHKHHTTTHMGSGHFAGEGFRKSSYIRNPEVVNRYDDLVPANLTGKLTHPSCYDLEFGDPKGKAWGSYFYYGGPGYSKTCL